MNLRAIAIFKQMVGEINEVTGTADGRPRHRARRSAQSDIADVILEQIEDFAADWVKGTKEAKEQALEHATRQFWPRIAGGAEGEGPHASST